MTKCSSTVMLATKNICQGYWIACLCLSCYGTLWFKVTSWCQTGAVRILKKALGENDEYAIFTGTNLHQAPCVIPKMEPTDSHKLGQRSNCHLRSCQRVSDSCFPMRTDVCVCVAHYCYVLGLRLTAKRSICLNLELVCDSPFQVWPWGS